MVDLSKQVILAVDDEPDNLQVFKATLEMLHDAIVDTAQSCQEALTKLENFHPTLIITDLSMPKADGYVLLYQLRQRPDTANLPIIALTAHAMTGDRERIIAAGFNGYISKPFDVVTLGEQLSMLLESFTKDHSRADKSTDPVVKIEKN